MLLLWPQLLAAQDYTRQDTLRGALTPLRTCYDVLFYDLSVSVNFAERRIEGTNIIHYRATQDFTRLQLDLFDNLMLGSIRQGGVSLPYEREGNAVFVRFPTKQVKGQTYQLTVVYGGHPIVARYPPWDGGFTWKKDAAGQPWLGVSCQHKGASLWWPNKDHPSDEPDSMRIRVTVPTGLMAVSNGQLRSTTPLAGGQTLYNWFVSYPINNYCVTLNVANYATFAETYTATDGSIMPCDYYVLPENINKAKGHFKQVQPMLKCFEEWFGKYPFDRDGYALVETPYLGMEHQGAVAYGNKYQNGYLGNDMSGTGVGLAWDYIIVHESGHEWFGNSLTAADNADLWIQEGFTTYSEVLYTECQQGYEAACRYAEGLQKGIQNAVPLVSVVGVNAQPTGDIYPKGANLLHTIRNVLNNDALWKKTIRGFAEAFKHQVLSTPQVIAYFEQATGHKLKPIFRQYLYHAPAPALEYRLQEQGNKATLSYRLEADEKDFGLPIKVGYGKENYRIIQPSAEWQTLSLTKVPGKEFRVSTELFYVIPKKVK